MNRTAVAELLDGIATGLNRQIQNHSSRLTRFRTVDLEGYVDPFGAYAYDKDELVRDAVEVLRDPNTSWDNRKKLCAGAEERTVCLIFEATGNNPSVMQKLTDFIDMNSRDVAATAAVRIGCSIRDGSLLEWLDKNCPDGPELAA